MRNLKGAWIGEQGWTERSDCEALATKSLNGDLVCGWNGKTFQFYHVPTTTPLGQHPAESGYKDSDSCSDGIRRQPAKSRYACAWNGQFYGIADRLTNASLGNPAKGWRTIDSCIEDGLSFTTEHGVCTWDGGWAIFLSDGTPLNISFGQEADGLRKCKVYLSAFVARFRNLQGAKKGFGQLAGISTTLPPSFKSAQPSEKVGFKPWKDCGVREQAWHLSKADAEGFLLPQCTPDTLYSWGDVGKLEWFRSNLPNGAVWPEMLPRTLYTTLSAAGTFGYGPLPIRIKLKPGVRMKLAIDKGWKCEEFIANGVITAAEAKTTVVARLDVRSNGFSLLEYDICSSAVIESWSHSMPEHLDEILRDDAWIRSQDYQQWETYAKSHGKDDYIGATLDLVDYKTDFTMESLVRRVWGLRVLAELGLGEVSAPAGSGRRTVKAHFDTLRPTHFNPD